MAAIVAACVALDGRDALTALGVSTAVAGARFVLRRLPPKHRADRSSVGADPRMTRTALRSGRREGVRSLRGRPSSSTD
jgi:hypothetical protein